MNWLNLLLQISSAKPPFLSFFFKFHHLLVIVYLSSKLLKVKTKVENEVDNFGIVNWISFISVL